VQFVQGTPFNPHVVSLLFWQVPAESTHPAQPPAVQLPPEQVWPLAAQFWHATPPKPQLALLLA
jgi:hypothetical protein